MENLISPQLDIPISELENIFFNVSEIGINVEVQLLYLQLS